MADLIDRQAMFEVPYGQDPYSAIGRYIRENITVIEDIIAVIDIDGVETNELFMVDMEEDGFFVWKSDWYEGEKKVVLIDFFPVSEATNSSVQPNVPDTNVGDIISRQAAIKHLRKRLIETANNNVGFRCDAGETFQDASERVSFWVNELPSADVQPVRHGKWKFWERREPQYDISGVKTWGVAYICSECGFVHNVIEDFGHYVYCPNCGARMDGKQDG